MAAASVSQIIEPCYTFVLTAYQNDGAQKKIVDVTANIFNLYVHLTVKIHKEQAIGSTYEGNGLVYRFSELATHIGLKQDPWLKVSRDYATPYVFLGVVRYCETINPTEELLHQGDRDLLEEAHKVVLKCFPEIIWHDPQPCDPTHSVEEWVSLDKTNVCH